jgi:hypothetical protein
MTDLIFQDTSGRIVAVTIIGKNKLMFSITERGIVKQSTIEGLKFNISGIIKEFPDLRGQSVEDIRKQAIQRFKIHIAKLKNHQEIEDYLVSDLVKKHGYKYVGRRRPGFRFEKNKNA